MNDENTQLLYEELDVIGISPDVAKHLIEVYGEDEVQMRLAAMTWTMRRTKVNNPPGWLVRSLREKWAIPQDLPQDWKSHTLKFRLDYNTFVEIKTDVEGVETK